jgi:hypothetical protein
VCIGSVASTFAEPSKLNRRVNASATLKIYKTVKVIATRLS